MLDKYSTVQVLLSFYLYFCKCFPNPFRQYLHKLKVFFVRGVPSLFSAMLHPCNLASYEVKVSSALKIIKVRLYNLFICILDPLQFYTEETVSRLIRSQEQSLETIMTSVSSWLFCPSYIHHQMYGNYQTDQSVRTAWQISLQLLTFVKTFLFCTTVFQGFTLYA